MTTVKIGSAERSPFSIHKKFRPLLPLLVVASCLCSKCSYGKGLPQAPVRPEDQLPREADNLSGLSSNDERVFAAVPGRTLLVDWVKIDEAFVKKTLTDAEWGQEIYAIGFRSYVLVNHKSYWKLEVSKEGFTANFSGPYPIERMPTTYSGPLQLAKTHAVKAKADHRELLAELHSLNNSHTTASQPTHTIKTTDPIVISYMGTEKKCVSSLDQVSMAMLRGSRSECLIYRNGLGHQVAFFLRSPYSKERATLVQKYGAPDPGRYRLLSGDPLPEYEVWHAPGNVRVAAKPSTGNMPGQRPEPMTIVTAVYPPAK